MQRMDVRWPRAKGWSLLSLFIFRSSFILLVLCLAGNSAVAGQLNINRASQEELTALPYIGKARARAIISHRRQHGPFHHLEDLLAVETIGPKSLEAISPYISLSSHGQHASPASFHLGNGQIMLLADEQYFPVLINFIKTADQRIDMAMFLFKSSQSKNNKPAQLIEELIKASQRGVRVNIVLEKSGYNESLNRENDRVAARLQAEKIRVRFDSPTRTSHSKMIIIDNRFCFVGSHNLTHSALAFNHEMSLLLDNRKMAADLTDYIDAIK